MRLSLPVSLLAAIAVVPSCQLDEDMSSEDSVGTSREAIVGGVATADFRAVPQLTMVFSDGTGGSCTGTLISQRVVLTASHCVDPEPGETLERVEVRFGPISSEDNRAIEIIPMEDYFWFPNWNFSGNDMALILMEGDASAQPMPFNKVPLNGSDLGKDLTLVGWGVTSTGGTDSGTKRVAYGPLVDFDNSMVLRYGDSQGSTCNGDSGGPGFLQFGGKDTVVSITSFHTGSCGGFTGVSGGTRVATYADVIQDFIDEYDVPIPPEVAFSHPKDGDEVRGGFNISVDATDNTRVETLEIYVNGTLSSSHTDPPYVDFAELPPGPAKIEARATDNRGDTTTASINVTVVEGSDMGATCTANEECSSNLCASLGGESRCTQTCATSAECPAGFECVEGGACWPEGGSGGGCNTGKSGDAGALFGLFGLLLLALRRRRR